MLPLTSFLSRHTGRLWMAVVSVTSHWEIAALVSVTSRLESVAVLSVTSGWEIVAKLN